MIALEIKEDYNINGDITIKYEDCNGYAVIKVYDKDDNMVLKKDVDKTESLYKYDSKGNMIFSRVSNSERGYEIIKLYNDLGEVIYTQVHNSKK